MKLFFAACLVSFSFLATGQEVIPVSYEDIESEISNPGSKNYYPKLLKRYNEGDATLTLNDYRLLYYGFTFQEAYEPYTPDPRESELAELMASNMTTLEDFELLTAKAKEILSTQPFNLKILYYLKNFNLTLERTEENSQIDQKFNGILGAILSSGTGKSEDSGFYINTISDEYMILQAFGLTSTGQEYRGNTDYVILASNDLELEGYYFDNTRLMAVGTKQIGVETVEVYDDQLPENGIEIGSDDEILPFIPLGYEPLFKEQGDADGDGDSDWAIVLKKEGEEILSNAAADDPEPRLLLVLARADDGVLDVVVRNNTAIPCIDCGGEADPFESLKIETGRILFSTIESGLLVTERLLAFDFSSDSNSWMLQEDSISSYRKGKEAKRQTLTETPEDFGEVNLRNFSY